MFPSAAELKVLGSNQFGETTLLESEREQYVRRTFSKQYFEGSGLSSTGLAQSLKKQFDRQLKINHPSIVPFVAFEESDQSINIYRKYVVGRSLSDVIVEEGPQLPSCCVRIVSIVVDVIHYLHSIGLTALSIRTPDIILEEDGGCKLVDICMDTIFAESLNKTGSIVSCIVSSLQTQSGATLDEKFDVFKAGLMLYIMIVGGLPWEKKNLPRISQQISANAICIPQTIDPSIQQLMRDMFNSDPKLRPTAQDVLHRISSLHLSESNLRMPMPVRHPIIASQSLKNVACFLTRFRCNQSEEKNSRSGPLRSIRSSSIFELAKGHRSAPPCSNLVCESFPES